VDGKGGILSVTVAGANVHDAKMLAGTIAAMIVGRPHPDDGPQHLCLDKGYCNPTGKAAAQNAGYIAHIRQIGEEKRDIHGRKKYPARRWVAERAGAWLSKCRAILVRYNKKSANYLGLIQLAVSLLWYRRAVGLGMLKLQNRVLR
jgi:putative transposase